MSCYKVIYSKSGRKVGSDTFNDYDDALACALDKSSSNGYLCVLLDFNLKKGTWRKRCTVYPSESC